MTTFRSTDVLRFLGRRIPLSGDHLPKRFAGEVVSDLHERQEGVRIKHRLNDNSVKRGAAGSPDPDLDQARRLQTAAARNLIEGDRGRFSRCSTSSAESNRQRFARAKAERLTKAKPQRPVDLLGVGGDRQLTHVDRSPGGTAAQA